MIAIDEYAELGEQMYRQDQAIARLRAERNRYRRIAWAAIAWAAAASVGMLICWTQL